MELGRALLTSGHVPFARTSNLYLGYGIVGWVLILLLAAQLLRIHRANRGLQADFDVALTGDVRSAYRLAARLGNAMGKAGFAASEVIKEDYGAGVWISVGDDRFWLAVSTDDDSDDAAITLAYDPGFDLRRRLTRRADRAVFARLTGALRDVIAADRALRLQLD